ncbi:MAG: hypothetical protein ACOC4Z_01830 [Patescibacteria group bacterium]
MDFTRNLQPFEIYNQILLFNRHLKKNKPEQEVQNVVFMGMGEPFFNYKNVLKAVRVLNDPDAFKIGARRISISTIGNKKTKQRRSTGKLGCIFTCTF